MGHLDDPHATASANPVPVIVVSVFFQPSAGLTQALTLHLKNTI